MAGTAVAEKPTSLAAEMEAEGEKRAAPGAGEEGPGQGGTWLARAGRQRCHHADTPSAQQTLASSFRAEEQRVFFGTGILLVCPHSLSLNAPQQRGIAIAIALDVV
jgi:hypothetical protein